MKKPTREPREQCKPNLDISKYNKVTFGSKLLCSFGPKVCNSFLYHLKSSENLKPRKELC